MVTLVSLCHVCLGIVEGRDNMYSTIKMDWWVETSFCVIYMIDSMIVLKFIGKERWLKQEVWIFVLSLLVLLDVMLVAADLSKLHYPVLRFLRPAFFAARRRHLKACFVSMFKSMFACLPLMLILSFSVIIFAVIGWIGFDSSKAPYNTLNHEEGHCSTANHGDGTNSTMPIGSCNDYFLTFSSSIYQVWILLVKVNMPDIMMPYYKLNGYSSIYFIVFTVFTQFFFLRLILAASFTNYKRDYEERHRRRLAFKNVAVLKAFALLSGSGKEATREIIQQPRGRRGLKRLSSVIINNTSDNESVKLSAWRKMMVIVRPDLRNNPWIYDLIFAASSTSIKTPEDFVGDPTLNFQEFCECCHSVNLKVEKSFDELPKSMAFTQLSVLTMLFKTKSYVRWLVLETSFEYVMQFLLALTSISAIICNSDKTQVSDDVIRTLEGIVAALFTVAVLASNVARGRKFWHKFSNQVLFAVMIAILSLYVAAEYIDSVSYDDMDSSLSLLYLIVVLRSTLFIRFHPEVTSTITTIRLILPMLLRIGVVFMSVMYAFVMIGCSMFENSLVKNDALTQSAYHAFHYDELNFASFWSTFVLLHQCLLGPNFPVFIEAVAMAHGSWFLPTLYFGTYYVVVVVFVQNVVVAFILEAYISQRKKQGGKPKPDANVNSRVQLSQTQKSWMLRMHRGLNTVMNARDAEKAIQLSTRGTGEVITFEFSRRPPHHELYDSVFHGDELDPAKIKIKMKVGDGFVQETTNDLSESFLDGLDDASQEGRRLYDIGGDEIEGIVVDGSLEDIDTNVSMLQQRVLELEESEKRLRLTLQQVLSSKS
ncbi:hypothetical protein TL16_g00104 [Triparma laevis f. inornata]|uniref:Ion transport domain-containing protein n=1 Tax=Triparma laevis f. inornata TaxID=1714386 RepID=A0A9W7DR13_9STRA|nr:hypothetical protein TL16_g00104 [Triparma laevis f. inornata]